ncbi:MAG: 50S ribosome-binding GTPase [Candidatus Omnitrophica bacterium]|nr:50S ribosome-binding GTPase [Candidatus Omnitrophota bacterium]
MDSLKFIIVGHVDHGKSTLIGRLLYDTDSLPHDRIEEIRRKTGDRNGEREFAYLLDHLEEERQQGITIDTTQVFFKTNVRQYVIIDAPGHVEFVKNMVTGASQAEAAILIIDAAEGVKEQTKRHAYILSILGISQVIVVINKMDLVGYGQDRFNEVRDDILRFLGSIGIRPISSIPISAKNGENVVRVSKKMKWHKGPVLVKSLDLLKSRIISEDKPLLLPIQDVYKMDDKRISVGRIETGNLAVGNRVKILPSGQITEICSIEYYLQKKKRAFAGESIGIVTRDSVFLNRGDIVCEAEKEPVFTDNFSANIFWLTKEDFRKDERLTIRCATQETSCKIIRIGRRMDSSSLEVIEEDACILKNLEVGEVVIETKKPIAIKDYNDVQELGRFVFARDNDICAGGIITNSRGKV